ARGSKLLMAGAIAGVGAGLAFGPLAALAPRFRSRGARAVLASVALAATVVIYLENAYFAPQSSYGIHVLLLTALAACAALAFGIASLQLPRRAALVGVGLLVVLAIPTDLAMRTRPRLAYLAKLRTSTTMRCVDLLSGLMDWDRDGFAPGFLVGGWDLAPFDPARPAPILDRSRGARPTGGDGSPADPAAPVPAAAAPHIIL